MYVNRGLCTFDREFFLYVLDTKCTICYNIIVVDSRPNTKVNKKCERVYDVCITIYSISLHVSKLLEYICLACSLDKNTYCKQRLFCDCEKVED